MINIKFKIGKYLQETLEYPFPYQNTKSVKKEKKAIDETMIYPNSQFTKTGIRKMDFEIYLVDTDDNTEWKIGSIIGYLNPEGIDFEEVQCFSKLLHRIGSTVKETGYIITQMILDQSIKTVEDMITIMDRLVEAIWFFHMVNVGKLYYCMNVKYDELAEEEEYIRLSKEERELMDRKMKSCFEYGNGKMELIY